MAQPLYMFVEGVGLKKAFSGKAAKFRISTVETGLVASGKLKVTVEEFQTKKQAKVEIIDKEDNTYIVKYTCPTVGDYLVKIEANGEEIEGSPFSVKVLQGPIPSKCVASGPCLQSNSILQSGSQLEFFVDATQAGHGNLAVIVKGKTEEPKVFVSDDENKIHSVKFEPQGHGRYYINAFWSGEHIPGSPFKLKIHPQPSAANVKAYGPGLEEEVVIEKRAEFTIDTSNAGVGTLSVRVHGVKGKYKVECQPKSEGEPRIVLGAYEPMEAGDYTVAITFEGDHIPGSPFEVKVVDKKK